MVQLSGHDWNRIQADTAVLPRRTRGLLVTAAIALTVALLTGLSLHTSGAITPHLRDPGGWNALLVSPDGEENVFDRFRAAPTTHVGQQISVTNEGSFPVTIVGVDVDRPGMRVERVTVGDIHLDTVRHMWPPGGETLTGARTLQPDETLTITVYYDITDCEAITAEVQPVPIRLRRWWGVQTLDVTLPPVRPFRSGGWEVSTAADGRAVQWQRMLADHVCRTPFPPGAG
jgi:hypothetical protein